MIAVECEEAALRVSEERGQYVSAVDRYVSDHWAAQAKLRAEHEINGWHSPRSQTDRMMRALTHCAVEAGDSVLDWGCGTGMLYDLLPASCRYYGVDPSAAMLTQARSRRPEATFMDLLSLPTRLEPFDHMIALGCWNLRPWTPDQSYEQVAGLWQTAQKSVCATLRTAGDYPHVAHDLSTFIDLAAFLTDRWLLDSTYHAREAMLVLLQP